MSHLIIQHLGLQPYETVWQQMKDFVAHRQTDTMDEIWCLQHPPVFTQGQAGKAEHILNPKDIPVVQTDRGGQITYHGPGQLVIYFLLDLNRSNLGVRELVSAIEQSIVDTLADYHLPAHARQDAPGVYIGAAKIASLGLRIKKGFSYHGLSLNIDMDLEPFSRINPCGFQNMAMTQLSDWVSGVDMQTVSEKLCHHIQTRLRQN